MYKKFLGLYMIFHIKLKDVLMIVFLNVSPNTIYKPFSPIRGWKWKPRETMLVLQTDNATISSEHHEGGSWATGDICSIRKQEVIEGERVRSS